MKQYMLTQLFMITFLFAGCAQSSQQTAERIGGSCEGCEAIHESLVPFNKLSWTDTMPDFAEPGPKLVVTGTVFSSDGKTPKAEVVIYAYHTDQTGHYSTKGNEKGWGKRNGYIRGWVKTNSKGEYQFLTNIPAPYPGRKDPAHIHMVVKEPGKNEYWIDEIVFDNDPLLTPQKRKTENRGGSGIVELKRRDGVYCGKRNIFLGKNIPAYPIALSKKYFKPSLIGEDLRLLSLFRF